MSHPSHAFRPQKSAPGAVRPARTRAQGRIPWGGLEWFVIAQTFVPALLFVPGTSPFRSIFRVASFAIALVAWAFVVQSGRTRPGTDSFSATGWLKATTVWLLLMVMHPNTNSLLAGIAQACLYIAVFSPTFWAPSMLVSQKQMKRIMLIFCVCNGLSALVGLGQVFRPATFNPPVIQALENPDSLSAQVVTYQDDFGNKIIRPCGLTDQVGAAAPAGATAALIALAYALRPIGFLRRVICVGLAFVGVAVIYYSQVRMILMMFVICLFVLVVLFALQKNFAYATMLGGLSAAIIAGALSWVAATSGWTVVDRFLGLFTTNIAEKYQSSRGGFISETFNRLIWEYPLGNGLGWWGTIYGAFGDKSVPSKVWVEVMWPGWVMDGGIPLMVLYVGAITLAIGDSLRIALKSRDRDLAFWAAVVFASNLSAVATSFSYVTFLTGIGMQFWLLSAVVHASDIRVRTAMAAEARAKHAARLAAIAAERQPEPAPASPDPGPIVPPPATA